MDALLGALDTICREGAGYWLPHQTDKAVLTFQNYVITHGSVASDVCVSQGVLHRWCLPTGHGVCESRCGLVQIELAVWPCLTCQESSSVL